jgi:hypothetical protein
MSRLAQWNLPAYGGESLFDYHDEQPARLLFEGGYPTLDFSGFARLWRGGGCNVYHQKIIVRAEVGL